MLRHSDPAEDVTGNRRFVQAPGCVSSEVESDFLVVSPTLVFYSLNETGRFMWESLGRECSEAELVAAATAEFDVSEVRAREAVRVFLADMKSRDLVSTLPAMNGEAPAVDGAGPMVGPSGGGTE